MVKWFKTKKTNKCKVIVTLGQICHLTSRQWRCHRPPERPHLCSRWSLAVQTWTRAKYTMTNNDRKAKFVPKLTKHLLNVKARGDSGRQLWLENILLWFPWWDIQRGAGGSHVLRKHIHPHLNPPLKQLNREKSPSTKLSTSTWLKGVAGWSRASGRTPNDPLVQCPVCQGGAGVWSPHAPGPVCSRPVGFPPSASGRSEPDVHPSASSNLTDIIEY